MIKTLLLPWIPVFSPVARPHPQFCYCHHHRHLVSLFLHSISYPQWNLWTTNNTMGPVIQSQIPRSHIPDHHYFSKKAIFALRNHVEEKASPSLQLVECSKMHATVDTCSRNYGSTFCSTMHHQARHYGHFHSCASLVQLHTRGSWSCASLVQLQAPGAFPPLPPSPSKQTSSCPQQVQA